MRKTVVLALVACWSVAGGCAPSLAYRLGQGFYSDSYEQSEVRAAASIGRLRNLGHFATTAGGCGNYSEESADRKIVIPAVQAKLKDLGANVADRVVVKEAWYESFMDLVTVPTLLGCSYWTISGQALLVEEPGGPVNQSLLGRPRSVFSEPR